MLRASFDNNDDDNWLMITDIWYSAPSTYNVQKHLWFIYHLPVFHQSQAPESVLYLTQPTFLGLCLLAGQTTTL